VDFNHLPVVVSWLRSCNAAWLGPIKKNTSFERSRSEAGSSPVISSSIFGPVR
jgi:hypothetical protein